LRQLLLLLLHGGVSDRSFISPARNAFDGAPTNTSDLTSELQYYGQGVNVTRNKLPSRWLKTICCSLGKLLRILAAVHSDNHGISISRSINLLLFYKPRGEKFRQSKAVKRLRRTYQYIFCNNNNNNNNNLLPDSF